MGGKGQGSFGDVVEDRSGWTVEATFGSLDFILSAVGSH